MSGMQALPVNKARFTLYGERLGPLPLVNHFLQRLALIAAVRVGAIQRMYFFGAAAGQPLNLPVDLDKRIMQLLREHPTQGRFAGTPQSD